MICSETSETVKVECPDYLNRICHNTGCPRFLSRVSKDLIDDSGQQLYRGMCILNGDTEWFYGCLPFKEECSQVETLPETSNNPGKKGRYRGHSVFDGDKVPQDIESKDVLQEVLDTVRETKGIVTRIDARDVERGKRQKEIEKQDKCYNYWELGRQKVTVKSNAKGKVTYEDVFNYYKKELESIGVLSCKDFSRLLTRRSKRLSNRAASK